MRAYEVDIREVFPDAPTSGKLELHTPPTVDANTRAYEGVGVLLVAAAAAVGFFAVVLERAELWAVYAMTFLPGLVVLFIGRHKANAGRLKQRRVPWELWATQRGLEPVEQQVLEDTGLGPFVAGSDREWTGLHRGLIGRGSFPAIIGATAYTKGSGKTRRRDNLYFVYAQLSAEAAAALSHSNVRRFCITPVEELDIWLGDEIRLESIDLDETHEIEVSSDTDPVMCRVLFGPQMIDTMTTLYEVQWTQRGRHILFAGAGDWQERVFGRLWEPKAPAQRLDSLCAAAAYACGQIEAAAAAAR